MISTICMLYYLPCALKNKSEDLLEHDHKDFEWNRNRNHTIDSLQDMSIPSIPERQFSTKEQIRAHTISRLRRLLQMDDTLHDY